MKSLAELEPEYDQLLKDYQKIAFSPWDGVIDRDDLIDVFRKIIVNLQFQIEAMKADGSPS
jgi:hypothetical protein